MSGFVKLYGSILGSSIWSESLPTRIVWITLLALADERGRVEASVGGLARLANVTRGQCVTALETLSSPDPDSKSPEFEGRRIEKVSGGWCVLNYLAYRGLRSPKQVAEAKRKAEWRERTRDRTGTERDATGQNGTSPEIRTEVDVDVDVETTTTRSKASARKRARPSNGVVAVPPDALSSWVARLAAVWAADVGPVKHGQLGSLLKATVDKHGETIVARAMQLYIASRRGEQKPCKLVWFVENIVIWLEMASQPLDVIDGVMTPTLELLTRP